MKVLVTGGLGFIGSHFIDILLETFPGVKVVNLDKRTYAANLNLIYRDGVVDIEGDIAEKASLKHAALSAIGKVDYIVNFAAETHVDNSIENSDYFVKSNINGVHNILELVKLYRIKKFLQVSTDEVYGSAYGSEEFTEESHYAPNSPYSASKGAAELLCRAYKQTYGLPVMITRSSNNYGPRQHKEKLIPNAITKILRGAPVEVYGDGKNERDWIYVKDNCEILLKLLFSDSNDTYNIASGIRMSNLELVKTIETLIGKGEHRFVVDREGHDFRYCISNKKLLAREPMHFTPLVEGLRKTIAWYSSC